MTLKRRHVYCYRVKLAKGAYTWVVRATDIAGNVQIKTGRRSLRVVNWVIHTTADVQRCLIALDYLPSGAVTGVDDYRTQQALMAFQAWSGLTRDGAAGRATRARLELASAPKPRAESASGHYAEIFRSLGVLLCVNNGKLVRVVHCSTGRPSLPTPAGHFSIFLKSLDWWSTKYLDWMPFASFFSGGDAIHGFPDVPAYPASHGCVPHLDARGAVGVHVPVLRRPGLRVLRLRPACDRGALGRVGRPQERPGRSPVRGPPARRTGPPLPAVRAGAAIQVGVAGAARDTPDRAVPLWPCRRTRALRFAEHERTSAALAASDAPVALKRARSRASRIDVRSPAKRTSLTRAVTTCPRPT